MSAARTNEVVASVHNGDAPAARAESGRGVRERLFWVTPRAARRSLVALHAAAALAVVIELFFPFGDGGHGVERVPSLDFPGSYALYGFLACVVLVLLGRVLRRLVMRSDDYYEVDR